MKDLIWIVIVIIATFLVNIAVGLIVLVVSTGLGVKLNNINVLILGTASGLISMITAMTVLYFAIKKTDRR